MVGRHRLREPRPARRHWRSRLRRRDGRPESGNDGRRRALHICPAMKTVTAVWCLVIGVAVSGCSGQRAQQSLSSQRSPVAVLRVCADPNNLPFSNSKQQGLENKLADLVAKDFGARVVYTWWPQRRGFVRMTLKANDCDVVMGIPSNFEQALPTLPYYRS